MVYQYIYYKLGDKKELCAGVHENGFNIIQSKSYMYNELIFGS